MVDSDCEEARQRQRGNSGDSRMERSSFVFQPKTSADTEFDQREKKSSGEYGQPCGATHRGGKYDGRRDGAPPAECIRNGAA